MCTQPRRDRVGSHCLRCHTQTDDGRVVYITCIPTTCCGEIFKVHNVEIAHVTLTTPLAVVSQCTEYEVSRFTRYEAVNGGAKCRKWGGLGVFKGHSRSWAMPPFDRAHTTSYSTLIETIHVYLLPFSRYRRLFVESRRF